MATILVISLSIVGQLVLTATYISELLASDSSVLNRVKSVLAAATFILLAVFLGWALVTQPFNAGPNSLLASHPATVGEAVAKK